VGQRDEAKMGCGSGSLVLRRTIRKISAADHRLLIDPIDLVGFAGLSQPEDRLRLS
jgi:hypothetical protein